MKYFITICSTSIVVRNIKISDCVFGKMGDEKYVKSNYLDIGNENGYPVNIRAVIIKTINDLHKKCGRWNPFSHNCEHVATSVRYGFQNCEQVINIRSIRLRLLFVMRVTVMQCLLWLLWMWYFCTGLMLLWYIVRDLFRY